MELLCKHLEGSLKVQLSEQACNYTQYSKILRVLCFLSREIIIFHDLSYVITHSSNLPVYTINGII